LFYNTIYSVSEINLRQDNILVTGLFYYIGAEYYLPDKHGVYKNFMKNKNKNKYEINRRITGGRISMILDVTKGRRIRIVLAVLVIVATLVLWYILPQIIRFAIDNILSDIEVPDYLKNIVGFFGGIEFFRNNLWMFLVIYISVLLLETVGAVFRRYLVLEAAEYIAMNLRNKLFSHIQKLPFSWHVKNQTGDIIQRSTSDVETIRQFTANDLPELFRSFMIIILSLTMMLSMDKIMTVTAVILMPVLFMFSFFYYGSIAKKFKESDEAEGALQATVQENFTGIRVVRAFGREHYEMERFDHKNDSYANKSMTVVKALGNYWGLSDIICGLQLVVVLTFGIFRCVNDGMSIGTFQTFYSYTAMLMWPVRGLGRTLSNFSKSTVSAKRIHEILREEHEDIRLSEKKYTYGNIEFKNSTFKYNEKSRTILDDISFKLEKGKTLGILGGTGSGKSTMSYLLTRLYNLNGDENGEILIDGVNIKEIPLADIRKNIALVLQEPFLFSKTIKQNITSPNPAADIEEIYHVASVANIHESIMEFPDQYETIVGERGVTLSGGQKQRVAIARMLMQKAPVMIFDDSLSAVDTETDAKIRAALKQHTANATVIIISHRISTLMHSDSILVLREGKIEDFGTHNDLIHREGTYKRIYDLQSAIVEEYK